MNNTLKNLIIGSVIAGSLTTGGFAMKKNEKEELNGSFFSPQNQNSFFANTNPQSSTFNLSNSQMFLQSNLSSLNSKDLEMLERLATLEECYPSVKALCTMRHNAKKMVVNPLQWASFLNSVKDISGGDEEQVQDAKKDAIECMRYFRSKGYTIAGNKSALNAIIGAPEGSDVQSSQTPSGISLNNNNNILNSSNLNLEFKAPQNLSYGLQDQGISIEQSAYSGGSSSNNNAFANQSLNGNDAKVQLVRKVIKDILSAYNEESGKVVINYKDVAKLDKKTFEGVLKNDENTYNKIKDMLEKDIEKNSFIFPATTTDEKIQGFFQIFLPSFFNESECAQLPLKIAIQQGEKNCIVTDASICPIFEKYKNTQSVAFNNCLRLTREVVNTLADNCHNVLKVDLSNSCRDVNNNGKDKLQDEDVIHLTKQCKNLDWIDFSQVGSALTHKAVTEGMANLDVIVVNLAYSSIADGSLNALSKYNSLESIGVEYCTGATLTPSGMANLIKQNPKLAFVGITKSSCDNIPYLRSALSNVGFEVSELLTADEVKNKSGRKLEIATFNNTTNQTERKWIVLSNSK